MKITEVNEWDKNNAVLDPEGNVLCPVCKKNLAQVSEYGMIRKCNECKDVKVYTCGYAFVDSNGRKFR